MQDLLAKAIGTAHRRLEDDLETATAAARDHADRREVIQKTDAFLIHTVRHVAAVCDVILPAAHTQLADGQTRVHEYVAQARRLERSVGQTKRRLYGESHAMALSWSRVWSELGTEFGRLNSLERTMVEDLAGGLESRVCGDLAERVDTAEVTSPTRPHPNAIHTGRLAHLSRSIWARSDRFWDAAEGRIVTGDGQASPAVDVVS